MKHLLNFKFAEVSMREKKNPSRFIINNNKVLLSARQKSVNAFL